MQYTFMTMEGRGFEMYWPLSTLQKKRGKIGLLDICYTLTTMWMEHITKLGTWWNLFGRYAMNVDGWIYSVGWWQWHGFWDMFCRLTRRNWFLCYVTICDAVFEICSVRSHWFCDTQCTLTTIVWFLRYVSHVNYHVNIKNQTCHEIAFGDMQCTLMGEIYDPSPGSPWLWDMCCMLLDYKIGYDYATHMWRAL